MEYTAVPMDTVLIPMTKPQAEEYHQMYLDTAPSAPEYRLDERGRWIDDNHTMLEIERSRASDIADFLRCDYGEFGFEVHPSTKRAMRNLANKIEEMLNA